MGTADSSVNLSQQLLSFFPVDTLQFHIVGPPSIQSVVDKLIHTGPPGYSFSFILVAGEFSGLEEVDNVPCPGGSLMLGNDD